MRKPVIAVLLALSVFMAMTAPASAQEGLPRERVYFECENARAANFETGPAGWTTEEPALTVAEGGGCGQGDIAGYSSSVGPATLTTGQFAGGFTGNLGAMNLRFDTISAGQVQLGATAVFDLTMTIDGRDALGGTRRLEVKPIPAAGTNERVHTYFLSIIALPYVDVAEDRAHWIELTVEPVNQPLVAWTYGAKEVPSGVEFNPPGYHSYKIQPNS